MKNLIRVTVFPIVWLSVATNGTTEIKITASDGKANSFFGRAVAISGDYAIVGAPYEQTDGGTGAAYVFKRESESWIEQQKLTASVITDSSEFGISVALDTNEAIVGAPGSESAFIFHRVGDVWMEQARLVASDGVKSDSFGTSVALDGAYAVIGARGHVTQGGRTGSAYIFKRTGNLWVEQTKLIASDGTAGAYFGSAVSMSGDYAVVGAPTNRDFRGHMPDSGAAYIFMRDGQNWLEQAKLTAIDGHILKFGQSVSISGDYAIVGGPYSLNDPNSGGAKVFRREGTSWNEEAELFISAFQPEFGFSVAISGDHAVVGAPNADLGDNRNTGSALLFERNGADWILAAALKASDRDSIDRFGGAVALSGDHIIVGAYADDDAGDASGSAYLFNRALIVGIEEPAENTVPENVMLRQNYPNPFNPTTTITYELAKAAYVRLTIFSIRGQQVRTLFAGEQPAGIYRVQWNGTDKEGKQAVSGVYLARLQVGDVTQIRKMLLVR